MIYRYAAIDLGTANTLVYVDGRGLVATQPSVIAINTRTGDVEAIGARAREMLGRTPAHLVAARPLLSGAIANIDLARKMLSALLRQLGISWLPRWKVAAAVPAGLTDVERHAVIDTLRESGASHVQLIEHTLAAAVGAGLGVHESCACMVVDIGAGLTETAIMSLGGIVTAHSAPLGGSAIDMAIQEYLRTTRGLLVGDNTAERVKIAIADVSPGNPTLSMQVSGQSTVVGMPASCSVTSDEIRPSIAPIALRIVEAIRTTIESAPPELAADLVDTGIVFTGGGALLRGLPELVTKHLGLDVRIADDPLQAGVAGAAGMLRVCFRASPKAVRYRDLLALAQS
jgi:rod shape-determining protein MreB